MKNPVVSIVLPTYNGARYLARSIRSVIDQTFNDWELVIVNDCSTDNSLQIAQSFAQKEPRIKIISNQTNKKLPAALNIGFAQTTGKYLTWTSDDNMYKPDALEKMVTYLDNRPTTDLIAMDSDYIDENDVYQYNFDGLFPYKRAAVNLLLNNNIGAAFMYRRSMAEKVGDYDEFTFCAEDYDYWCRIALRGNIEYTNDNIYQYRINPLSLSAQKRPQVIEKTKYIQQKYMKGFFKKFHYTFYDRARAKHQINPETLNFAEKIYILILEFITKKINGLSWIFFWNRRLRQHVIAKYSAMPEFSFFVSENTSEKQL